MLWEKNKVDHDRGRGRARRRRQRRRRRRDLRGRRGRARHRLGRAGDPRGRVRRPRRRHLGRLVAARAAEADRRRRRRRLGRRDRLRLHPLRHRGDADRDARPDPAAEDKDCVRVVERTFKKQGIEILTGNPDLATSRPARSRSRRRSATRRSRSTTCAIAGGRKPDTEGLGLEAAGVKTDEDGKIEIDEYQRTSNPKVYAIGDLVRGPALAHKAQEEGVVAVETIAGVADPPGRPRPRPGRDLLPPAGRQRRDDRGRRPRRRAREIKVGKFKLGGVGASVVYDDRDGIVKIVADAEYGEILGAHIVGNRACDMIAELVDTIALEGGYQELARIVHPHPTISEAVLDAARAVDGWAIHQ